MAAMYGRSLFSLFSFYWGSLSLFRYACEVSLFSFHWGSLSLFIVSFTGRPGSLVGNSGMNSELGENL